MSTAAPLLDDDDDDDDAAVAAVFFSFSLAREYKGTWLLAVPGRDSRGNRGNRS